MFSKRDELRNLIDKQIVNLHLEIEKENEKYEDLKSLYNELSENLEKILDISDKELKRLIDSFEIDANEELYKELSTIKKILHTNKDFSSTLRLFKKDKIAYQEFLKEFSNYLDRVKKDDKEKKRLYLKIEEYENLKARVENPTFEIDQNVQELLEELFINRDDSSSEDLLISLIEYENDTYNEKVANSKLKEKFIVNEKELVLLFEKYHYNFYDLKEDYKHYLQYHGNLNKIDGVFRALEENEFPHILDDYILTSILLGSNYDTINSVTSFSKENHLIPKSLLDISGALLEQKEFNGNKDEYSYMMIGSSLDFMRNIVTLKNAGISINYIFQECKSILTMPNTLLKNNLDLFYKYGFSFEYKRRGIIDPSPAALLSTNFASICDAFIEIHPLGLKYLIDNLSNLRTVSNPKALMFYNIYASLHTTMDLEDDDPKKGPFRKVLEEDNENYQLKAIITRNRPDYRDSYYLDIREDNKLEKTNTIEIKNSTTKKYDKIIDNNKDFYLNESIFTNPYIESIDEYIDEESALIYNFSGIRISRLKVLRIYNILLKNGVEDSLDSFMYAITYHTIISQDDYDKILDCIKKEVEDR